MIEKKLKKTESPLSIENLCKAFKSKQVLDKVSLDVQSGEIFGLIGLNGVGKTTMIKIMLNLLNADSGAVKFFGENCITPDSRRHICYLPEKFYPSPFLKGQEFLSLALSYYNETYNDILAKDLATRLDLDTRVINDKISKYSKGMSQKLGLMSVFMSNAPLLILDEPMSGLDPSARIELKELLMDYSKKGNTIFFSSHILSDLDEICDRIAILNDQKIIFIGKPSEFKAKYGNDSLERCFLRSINKIKDKPAPAKKAPSIVVANKEEPKKAKTTKETTVKKKVVSKTK